MTSGDDSPGYETARAELAEIVRALESGGQSLEDALALWERGEHLAAVCRRWLDGAATRLDGATTQPDGAATRQGKASDDPPDVVSGDET